MTKNPILNGLAALTYIAGLLSLVMYGPMLFGLSKLEQIPEIFAGITMLSLFVFSAAIMGYIFLYQPILLILAGERKEGTKLFLQTAASFAVCAIVFIALGLLATSTF